MHLGIESESMKTNVYFSHHCFHAPEDVEVNIKMSLKNLGLDYGEIKT